MPHAPRATALGVRKGGIFVRSFDRSFVDIRLSMLSIRGQGTLDSMPYP